MTALTSMPRILDDAFSLVIDDAGMHLLRFRYLERGSGGDFDAPRELFRRVA